MKNIDMQIWISGIINDSKRTAIPIMTHPGIELINAKVSEVVSDGKVHFEAIKALDERYPSAAYTTIMDLTVEAEAFGATVVIPEDEIPTVTGRLLSSYEDVASLHIPGLSAGRIPAYILANKLAADNLDKPVFGGIIGPFSLAGRLYDMSEIMIACYCEPDTAKLLLDKCTSFLIDYCKEIKKQGVQGVIIAEPAAGLLSGEGCSEFSSFYVKQIVDEVQNSEFIVVLHNCGNTGHCTPAMIETGAKGFHFGNKINMVDAAKECPAGTLAMGNLDPVTLFKSATVAEIKKATFDLLNATGDYPNFILSSGCDVPPHTPHENIEAFYEALSEFNRNR
ncbi:methylcobamide--CoM methyltransferase [Dysgonomonas sp. 521]|uniref:uroporphyrinogen decarboxylase family protein n=1 Tax=Dysgonomonas sp. 521 TaxID=2302932 RepID=UPI0013D22977|nr:uroporphyrinogen decarboxylase family protein [Dysgonomonas sp. 521]NDV95286.1 methylcobamide--CoM methyltransferase [Dysgonomonas sp. 521]